MRSSNLFAREGVESIALCDANLGMLPGDEAFIDDVIRVKERYGYPLNIESSWAKNKGERFFKIVRKMKQAGLKSLLHARPPEPGRESVG